MQRLTLPRRSYTMTSAAVLLHSETPQSRRNAQHDLDLPLPHQSTLYHAETGQHKHNCTQCVTQQYRCETTLGFTKQHTA